MFPGPTLLSAVTAIVESALNRALELDPAGKQALMSALTGPVQFSLDTVGLTLVLHPAGDRLRVASHPPETPALVLSGQPMAFAALAIGDDRVFSEGRIRVTGDTALAHQFQRAMDQLNPDWEAAMAAHVGDVPAHFIGQRIRGAVDWSRQAARSLNANIEEYIHEESRSLPGRRELEATFTDIDRLALQTERLEARVERLETPNRQDQPESP
ncbi:ubiquinone biosynthesis accessory factor UbiJ [Marinobacter sp. UBA2688]|jgi:ubiquinone biosynthesis protein UbiJ|uniref:ubiquinone biosynthesis accessory factor UbiJ n=1 Tax=Marinobacter sp. UBA2688 TaxID=1946816 RepID=UPI00257D2B67|nr:SCP2 sterol-binding domain-containing protein [Marinobacter sp. UBA2688]|tara:strand:+ start:10884 stop:11522 length:639 start_codon:yes stop_codon:yes gene_type:complete